jgi:hypothetical protein
MICVSVMLAVVQLWPLVFGGWGERDVAQAARLVPTAQAAVKPVTVKVPARVRPAQSGMPTCYQRYERAYASCGAGHAGCQLRAGDNWDVCEATGFWPE